MINLKKKIILSLMLVFFTIGCVSQSDYAEIPKGYTDNEEYYSKDGFQDHTDYAKYIYSSPEIITDNDKYEEVKEEDITNIKGYFEHFYSWMRECDRLDEYDFDESVINVWDYIRIKTKEGEKIGDSKYEKYDNYSVYYFDIETLTLYYIHSNI